MRLERRGLGVWVAYASGASTGRRTPLRREAITVVASFQEAWFLELRGVTINATSKHKMREPVARNFACDWSDGGLAFGLLMLRERQLARERLCGERLLR